MSNIPGFQPFAPVGVTADGLRKSSLDPFLSRSNYFDGKLLKASDLIRDQQYFDERLLQAGRAVGAGVVGGLLATLEGQRYIRVTPGLAITRSGRILELTHNLDVDLTDRALIASINEPAIRYLNRGLYAVVLRYTEKGVGLAETYPDDIAKVAEPKINSYEEGVELVLVPLRQAYPAAGELAARAALAQSFLSYRQPLSEIPDDGVALALLAVDNNLGQWLDRLLLYRPLSVLQSAHPFKALLKLHYQALLEDVLAHRRWSSLNAGFAAGHYFQHLPPVGGLPKSAIDPVNAVQTYFPDSFKVSIVPVRKEDLGLLEEEALALDVIDLQQDRDVDIVVLAPIDDDDFNFYARRLERDTAVVGDDPFDVSARLLPGIQPLNLNNRLLRRPATALSGPNYWRNVWERVDERQLRYVRKPPRIAENRVSTVVLARGYQLPEALPPTASELEQLNQRLLQAQQARDAAQAQLQSANNRLAGLEREYDVLKTEYENLQANNGETTLTQRLRLRGVVDKTTLEMAREYLKRIEGKTELERATADVLDRTDSLFDRALWPSLLQASETGDIEKLLKRLREIVDAGEPLDRVMAEKGRDFGLKDDVIALWQRIVEFRG